MAVRRFSDVAWCLRDLARTRACDAGGLGLPELSRRARAAETSRLLPTPRAELSLIVSELGAPLAGLGAHLKGTAA
jgi:hypothetical protein